MANNTYLQVRTNSADKERASEIVEALGTNLSAVVNMLLKQIVIIRSIPFDVKLENNYSEDEMISEVETTMAMENMDLSKDEVSLLKRYQKASAEDRNNIRKEMIKELMQIMIKAIT